MSAVGDAPKIPHSSAWAAGSAAAVRFCRRCASPDCNHLNQVHTPFQTF